MRSPGGLGAVMGGHQLVVGVVELDGAGSTPHPDGLAHQPVGGRVVRLLEGDVAIAADADLLPTATS